MMLNLDIQLLAKNLRMIPNLCRIEQTVSVLISKIKVLHTETTDPGVQFVSMQAAWHSAREEVAAGHCSQLCCSLASGAPRHPGLLARDPLLRVLPANLTSDSILGAWGD